MALKKLVSNAIPVVCSNLNWMPIAFGKLSEWKIGTRHECRTPSLIWCSHAVDADRDTINDGISGDRHLEFPVVLAQEVQRHHQTLSIGPYQHFPSKLLFSYDHDFLELAILKLDVRGSPYDMQVIDIFHPIELEVSQRIDNVEQCVVLRRFLVGVIHIMLDLTIDEALIIPVLMEAVEQQDRHVRHDVLPVREAFRQDAPVNVFLP